MEIDTTTRMGEAFKSFDSMMQTLYNYFGANYKAERVAAIWNYLKPCRIQPEDYRRLTELAQQKLESMAGNLGQRIKDIYYQDVKTAGARSTSYDPTEDYRYPIYQLQQALEILREKGNSEFKSFADQTGMPLNDRARVTNTFRIRHPEILTDQKRSNIPTQLKNTDLFQNLNFGR